MTLLYKQYEWFTPYHRGFNLVWDFLRATGVWTDGDFRVKTHYGYERSRDSEVFLEDNMIGSLNFLYSRYEELQPVYAMFMHRLETAATNWQIQKESQEAFEEETRIRASKSFAQRMLDKYIR